jgi:hypothetical protein
MNNTQETQDTEAIEIKTLSLVDATLQTAKASFAELVKESSVDKRAKELKAQLKKAEINGIEDNKGYALVKMISRDASKIRIAIEKRRKELKSDIITAGKNIDALANEYQSLINPIENDADAKLLIIDNAVKEAKEKAEREAKEKLDNRVKELIENGLRFDGFGYSINDINVGIQFIQELPDAEYETFLGKVKIQNELNIAEQKRKDEEAKEFQKIQDQLRLENERKQKELDEKQAFLDKQLADMKAKQDEIERKEREQKESEEKQIREVAQKAEDELVAMNAKQYENIGFKYIFAHKLWSIQIGTYHATLTREMVLANEESTYHRISTDVSNATQKENERIANEEATRIAKEKTDAQEAEKKRLAKLSEQQLFNEYISKIKAIEVPKLTDPMLLGLINKILDVIK